MTVGNNPSQYQNPDSEQRPVDKVSWTDACKFCEALTWREAKAGRIPKGYAYRLPTEAEWEYAARAGDKSVVLTEATAMDAWGWHAGNSDRQPHQIRQKQANAWGVYDLFGNVSEWCLDSWSDLPGNDTDRIDPAYRPEKNTMGRVYRGGDFRSTYFRSAYRSRANPSQEISGIGFRIVLATSPRSIDPLTPSVVFAPLSTTPPETGRPYKLPLPGEERVEMLALPAGEFLMGDSFVEDVRKKVEPPHPVRLSTPFWMSRCEVTQAQYQAIIGDTASRFKGFGPTAPVDNVSWYAAMEFCKRLNEQEKAAKRLPEGMVYRLPTVAEWEYACRANQITTPIMTDRKKMDRIAWNSYNSYDTPHPVGQKKPNGWGLCDMLGNVEEWCLDRWGSSPDFGNGVDPIILDLKAMADYRTLCGDSFQQAEFSCASRFQCIASDTIRPKGIRLVLGRAISGVDSPVPSMVDKAIELETLPPPDSQGFRKIPMDRAWWVSATFGMLLPEKGTLVLRGHPELSVENNVEKAFARSVTSLRKTLDVASQETEFSLSWKIVGERPPGDPEPRGPIIWFEAQKDGPIYPGETHVADIQGRLGPVVPGLAYRTTVLVLPQNDPKIVVTLFRRDDSGDVRLGQCDYSVSATTLVDLRRTRLLLQRNGPGSLSIEFSEILVRQSPARTHENKSEKL